MATPRFAWGIDIGNRALKAVKLVSTAEGLVIDDFDVIDHETVLSAAGDNRDSLIQTALANFVQKHPGIDKGQVGVGVTGQQSFARFIKLPPVEPKKIPEIVRFEAIQQIPFPLDEVEWSYQLFQDPESPEVEVGIFAMRKDLVNQHINYFTEAKLNVQVVQMNPLSVYNALYYDSRIKGTTMIIDVGAENTDLIIAEGETIWLRSISIGGNSFTEALTKSFKVNFVKAEELKRNASTSKYGRQIMQAMRPIFSELVSEIQRSIGFYSSVHKESRITKVIAVGSTFKLPGLHRYLSQNLTLEVEKLDRLGSGALEDPKVATTFSDNLLSAVGAYGLALQVMGQGKINSSLLPESIRRDKMWKEKTKWFVAAAAVFVVGAAVPYGKYFFENHQISSPENLALTNTIEEVQKKATKADQDWTAIEAAGSADKLRMLNVLSLPYGRDIWPAMNTLLFGNLPQNLEGAQKELTSKDPDEIRKIKRGDRNQIMIQALVSRYVPDLNLEPDIANSINTAVKTLPFATPGAPSNIDWGSTTFGTPSPTMNGQPTGPQAKPQRGFIVTLRLTTPSSMGTELIEKKYVNVLKTLAPAPDQKLQLVVVNAAFGPQYRIGQDTTRKTELGIAYQTKQKAKDAATHIQLPNDSGAPGGGTNPPESHYQPDVSGDRGGGGFHQPPPGQGGGPGRMFSDPSNSVGGNSDKVPPEALQDPVLHEDITNDTECILVLAIAIDPPPAAPVPAAPGKTVASAGGGTGAPATP